MSVTAYPVAKKAKSLEICRAFVDGCGGVVIHAAERLHPGPAFFYGVDASNVHLWREAKARGDFWYCDNSFFDPTRQQYFRVSHNRLQHSGLGVSDGKRFAELGIDIKPWRESGNRVVMCPQSDDFMRLVVGPQKRDWFVDAVAAIQAMKPRIPIHVREWSRDKTALAATLGDDLKDARALVTWSSAAAVTAVLEGVPVVVISNDCAAKPMSGSIYRLFDMPRPARENWAGVLADNQWSMDELRSGLAWQMLNTEVAHAA